MQPLETLRRRIEHVEDMQSVVTTMKTLAAVSIRQYEAAVAALSDYDRELQMGFQILLRDRDLPSQTKGLDGLAAGAVVFGSDQGMCGQFNDQIAEFAAQHIQREAVAGGWLVLTVGARAQGPIWRMTVIKSTKVSLCRLP